MTARGVALAALLTSLGTLSCSEAPAPATGDPVEHVERMVTLSPHLAELVVTAGAGERLVGVSAWSNYPEAVTSLPQVGDAFAVDLEQLSLLSPDAVLAWKSGTPARTVDELRALGYRVEVLQTRGLDDIAQALRRIGGLTGSSTADAAADRFLAEVSALRDRYRGRPRIRVFYQVSARPLYTVNGEHFASELIELCGGQNVFADLGELAPLVSEEAVLERNPELMIAGGREGDSAADDVFTDWRRWSELAAAGLDNFFIIDADLLARPTTRLVEAGRAICASIEEGRRRRTAGRGE